MGYKPNLTQNQNNFKPNPQFKFGIPQPQGFRPNLNQNTQGFKFGIPNQYRFGIPPQPQGYRPPVNNSKPLDTDVSMRTATRQYMLDEPEGNNNLFYNYELAETYCHPNEGDYEAYYDLYEEPTSSETTKNYPGFSRAGRTQQPEIVNLNCDSLLKLPHINLPEINARFMIDTGSTRSFISPRKVDEFFANYKFFEPFEVVSTHARSRHDEVIVIPLLKTFKSMLQHKFYVYDVDNRYDGLIGSDLLKQLGATIDMQNQVLRTKNVEIPIIYNPPYEVQLQPRTETRVTIPADLKDGEAIINFVDFGKDDTESMQVNVDESERRLHSYLDDVVSEIERLSNAQPNRKDEVISISSGEKEETTKHELETEYPILSPSESTITIPEGTMSNMSLSQTVHSAPDMDTNGIPILNEAIDSKPNQMLIYTWNRNEMAVKNISSNNQKILEAHLPTNSSRIRGSAVLNELIVASLAELKPLLLSRKDASKELTDSEDTDDLSTVRSSSSKSKKLSRVDKLEQNFSEMKDMLSNILKRLDNISDDECRSHEGCLEEDTTKSFTWKAPDLLPEEDEDYISDIFNVQPIVFLNTRKHGNF
ncbi:uncharacterized protein LOC126375082 [Pectinophora gossypiella]|uniref:uncharacterized protein LOC126375082 n=1 Tax=Pectinophora gossypiella TaxID=13191 RepID=UPI00214F5CB2|nr:uncharacterized protein LOC126375082 [Pectinophora gossypiella]